MSLFLCMVLESVLFHPFTSGWPVFPAPLVKEVVFFPLYILASFVKDKGDHRFVDLSLGILFYSIDLYFYLCANTILSWWLWLCSIVWSQAGWFLQFHSSFSRLFWLFEVFCIRICIFKKAPSNCYNVKVQDHWPIKGKTVKKKIKGSGPLSHCCNYLILPL